LEDKKRNWKTGHFGIRKKERFAADTVHQALYLKSNGPDVKS